ncbi:MAG TPA: thermonuclease family protein [Ferruginibacter sp.]|nr:thermonuclease family protein [Ferruginibacter sp.]
MDTYFFPKRFTFPTQRKFTPAGFIILFLLCLAFISASFGDSLYGKVTAVKSATEMTFVYNDTGKYEIRLIGIDVPKNISDQSTRFVTRMILHKNARIRFEGRTRNNEMLVRLFTDDSISGIKEVALELVKSGFALRRQGFDYKYGELSVAQAQAQKAKRGFWGLIK